MRRSRLRCTAWFAILSLKESPCNSEILLGLVEITRRDKCTCLIAEDIKSQILDDRAKLKHRMCIPLRAVVLQFAEEITVQINPGPQIEEDTERRTDIRMIWTSLDEFCDDGVNAQSRIVVAVLR